MTAKEHYDNHLGHFYSWMSGDFHIHSNTFAQFLRAHSVVPCSGKIAIDLGAGHGLQSIPLAAAGFKVIAVDFNQHLLDELKINAGELQITIVYDDMRNVRAFAQKPELIVCCGDTLSHVGSKTEVKQFIQNIAASLDNKGKLILSFRDYSTELTGTARFIPVKSDDHKILTCILEYEDEFVTVTDLLYEKTNDMWKQTVSAYKKVRLLTAEIVEQLEENGMKIQFNQIVNRLTTLIAINP